MFEKLIETILVEYVSEWVDGLDSEKMKIALFGGKVEFRELKLKTSSLDKFHLPLTVKSGTLGRLSMKVPWKRLTKEAVTIRIEDLYLLVVPAHEEELHRQRTQQQKSSSKATTASKEEEEEEDSYALRIRWAKQQEVRVRELLEKNKTEDAPSASSDNSSGDTTASWGYREKILHNIMDNVSFEFSKIHIRYEDTTQLLTKNPLALGVTIDSITVNTTNANGHVTFVDRAQSHTPFVHKILEMALAGFYCDDTSSVQDLVFARQRGPLASSYIIHPFNTNIKMTVNHDETTAFSIPKFQFVGDIGSINASVTPDQCNDLISVINFISTHELYLKRIHCRRKRPTVSVKRNAKKWWKYAFFGVQVMYSLSSRKLSGLAPGASSSALTRYNSPKLPCDWKLFGVLWKCQKEYIHLHKRMLRATAKKLPVESVVAERCRLNELEDILDVDSIVFFRICAAQELELEEARHDSVKKLSNWKARWNSRSHSQDSDAAAGLRSLDPLEKLVLYSTLSEQMHASSKALAAKERENSSSQTILFAIDVAISSIRLSLIEHYVYNSASTTGSTREFLQFELQQFVFAIFQRNGSSSISSSIKSIHMLDFSQVGDPLTGERLSQPLFYSLVSPNSTPVAVKRDQAGPEKTSAGATKAVATPPLKLFLDLKIESSETKFKLDCSFEPFRYIHNLSVAAKLQMYFVARVDVSSALKENAEDALAYSSEWLNNAVFAGPSAPSSSSNKPAKPGQLAASTMPARTVEFSIRLPEVDILVLTTDTSPILQVRSVNLDFKSGNLLDTFLFSVEGVTILFYDGTHAHENESVSDLQQPHGVKLLRHQDGLKNIRRVPSHGAMKVNISDYDLTRRKYSTILRKTQLMFHGEKNIEHNRPPKWSMKCTAPPIYFTLSSAQYRQVLQASASWGHSELELEAEENTISSPSSSKSISRETVTSDGEPSKKLHRSTSSFVIKEFDDEDERFGLSIMIPQILVVLEGEDRVCNGATGGDEQPPPVGNEQLAIDLVLDIKEVNVEAKFSSSAQAAAVDILSLAVFKRLKSMSKDSKKKKISTAEAIAKVNEEIAKSGDPHTECDTVQEPDPVYDPRTGAPTCKLLEVGPKASFVLCSADPFKGKIKAQQVVLYWDQDLLVALFRSYLLGNSALGSCSASPSQSSSRTSSSETDADKPASENPDEAKTSGADADSRAAASKAEPPGPFGIELHIERWYVYCRPHCTESNKFALKFQGKGLFGDITTLKTPFLVAKFYAKGGVTLESSRFVSGTDGCAPSSEGCSVSSPEGSSISEEVCELLSVNEPLTVIVESAGYGVLTHRTGAATYVHLHGSGIVLNYVNSHFGVFGDFLQNQLISFFDWISVQTLPAGVVLLDQRTKIDADFTKVKLLLPRGAVGNPIARQKKPERMEIDVKQVVIKSRPHPDCPRMEQLRIQIEDVYISTCMIDSDLRPHTDAIGSVDEAVASAKAKAIRLALEKQLAASKTRMFSHKAVFIEFVALPIIEDEKKKRRRKKKEAEEVAAQKKKGFKDIEDVAREMEKLCGHVKMTLYKPLDWDSDYKAQVAATHDESSTDSAECKEKRESMRIETSQEINLALDLQQLELFRCILNENFAESEMIQPLAKPRAANGDEYMAMDVQVLIGDVNLSMLCSNSILDYQEKKALSPEEREIALVKLRGVKVLISGYSSERAQYRVVSSKASLWKVDLVPKEALSDEECESSSSTITPLEKILTSCADMYSSPNAGTLDQCIDITIDQHEPSSDPNAAPLPQDIRVHVEACALTPSIIHFASRVEPFLFHKSHLPFYSPPPGSPVNVSVTTGAVYCMLANYFPDPNGGGESHDEPPNRAMESNVEDEDTALHLVLSGCFVVRYSDSDASLQHVQLFGRKMSLEIAAQWPPESESQKSSAAIAPSPLPSPTCSPISPTQRRMSASSRKISTQDLLSLAYYRRVLCDDFAIDMDLIDTLKSDGVMKIAASLTHFHAVLCVFDVMMISQIANFEFEDKDFQKSAVVGRGMSETNVELAASTSIDTLKVTGEVNRKTEVIVNMILEDASVTFVREIGEYFTPVARIYTFCAMCKIRVEMPPKVVESAKDESATPSLTSDASNVVEITLHFSEDSESELRDGEGMSIWGFNTFLGSWEPILEPWTFALNVTLVNDQAGKVITSIDLSGSDVHALSVNFSPSLLDSLCAITKEMEQLLSDPALIQVSRASVISCGFYLANDCGVEISYWVSDNGAASHTSRGYSYAPRQKRVPELLLPRHKVPLKLSTALFHSLPADQTVSFSWGGDDWHPLTDVRIHSAGKYVYSVLPRSKAPAIALTSAKPASATSVSPAQPPVLLALFDISSVFGYRTLTVSSLVRVFNDTDVAVDCGILGEDGKTITEVGTIEAHGACGIPITLVKAIASVRVLVKPHKNTPANSCATGGSSKSIGTSATVAAATDVKDHRWSNELFISEKEDCTEHFASCSLILDDYDCKCQRMFDGSQPLHVSQICKSNGSFFRVWNRMFTASNASSLRYSQMRVLPPLTFENKCGVALFVVVFVFKKVRRAGAQDREYFHLVASEKIPPRSNMQFLASSLHENTYCSVSMTGFSWSKLFLLPTVFPQSSSVGVSSTNNGTRSGGTGNSLSPISSTGSFSSTPSSPSSSNSSTNGHDVVCTLSDFRARQATINVVFVSASQEMNAMRKVIIQPRFVVHNDTPLSLLFEPRAKAKSKMSNAKAFFSMTSAVKKQAATCCGSPQLELIHSKLNALNGATTTPASPTGRSTVFRGSQGSGTSAAASSSNVNCSSASIQEEMEFFYCSESNFLNIQIEGNTIPSSGVQQFQLDAAMGGANSSLRLFDEAKKLWYDLVAILEQIDSFTTKVTFVERYLILNRTSHEILCMPACNIVSSSHHGQEAKQAHPSGAATVPTAADNNVVLRPSATTSFNWCLRPTIPSDSCIRLRIQGGGSGGDGNVTGWRWSGKVSLHEVSETALKLSNKYTSQVHVLRVEIRVESSVRVYIVLTSEDMAPFPLYRIINSSANEVIHFKQCFDGGSGELSEQSAMAADFNRGVTQRLLPGEKICFGWDEAYFLQSLERMLIISYSSEAANSRILLDQPGEAHRVEIPASKTKPASHLYLHWYLDGVTKTIHIHDTELPRDKLTGKQNAPPVSDRTESSSSVIQRAATLVSELNLNLKLPSILLSVLNSTPEEVFLFSAEKLDLAYAKTVNEHDQCEVKIGSFQLDNQLENAMFPVIFTPIPSNNFSSTDFIDSSHKPLRPMTPPTLQERKRLNADGEHAEDDDEERFLHISIFRLSYGDDVEYIKYFSAMLQPARLQIDDFLIISAASLFTDCMQVMFRHYPQNNSVESEPRTGNAGSDSAALQRGSSSLADGMVQAANASEDASIAKIPPIERRMYIETLQLHPMKIHITFQQNNLSKATFFDDQATLLLPVVFMILKSNLVNIDCASLNLNALHIYHSFTTRAFMFSTIQQHYTFQGILQIYALVGAADILGNPIGLVTNLGTGVKDFFYEPVAGMVKSPQEFVLGLSRGTASLVKNSVYGTFNAASKFTGTLSSGIAALSMDSKYIKERNTRNRQEVPTHLGTGLLYGTKQLGQGILAGVSGVITAPAMGAYNNGLTGFVEGVGKGLIGVAIKPTAGILDLAARTTAGITATATVFDKKARNTRVRLPRMMHTSDKRLRVYSGDEAMISQLLHRLPQKLLQNENYEAHVFLPLNRAVVATSHQFLHVDFSSIAAAAMGPSPPRITWKCPLTSLWGAQKTNRGVNIMIGTATNVQISPGLTTLVTKSSMSTVLVPLRETDAMFADRIVKCVAELVARQRERATPTSESYAAPPPRNSIGLVLEPVRDSTRVQGYEGSGGQVVDVFVGSACFRAGVEVGDIIIGFGGKKLERGDHGSALRYQLSLMKKGDTLELMILRNGETKTIKVATE